MSFDRIRRREFLERLGRGAFSAFVLLGAGSGGLACARKRDPLRAVLEALFDDPERAGIVGTSYRAQVPAEAAVEPLLARIFFGAVGAAREQAVVDPVGLYQRLRSQHRGDFAEGRVVNVEGWVLSLTEARVCAVVSLDEA